MISARGYIFELEATPIVCTSDLRKNASEKDDLTH